MAKCTGCGAELAPKARFCALCGKEAAIQPSQGGATQAFASAPVPAHQMQYPQPTYQAGPLAVPQPSGGGGGKVAAAVGAGVVLLAIAGFLFAKATGVLSARKTEAPVTGVLTAPPTQTVQAPVLSVPPVAGPKAAPVLAPPLSVGNPMPEDVIEYLRWLKKFEAARRNLEAKGAQQMTLCLQDLIKEYTTGASMGLLDGDSSGATPPEHKPMNYAAIIGGVIQEWNGAATIFQQKSPPNPCANLATGYNQALTAGVQQMSELQGVMTNAQASLKANGGKSTGDTQQTLTGLFAQKNSKQASQSVDGLYGSANNALDEVRNRYTQMPADIDKAHFDIKSDGGSLMMPPGLGM